MKNITANVLICLCILMVKPQWSNAQWVKTNAPSGGSISALYGNGTNLFAGTPAGVFLSSNNGNSWTPVNTGLPENNQTYSFAANGGTVFVGTGGYGIYASSNNGNTWDSVNNGLTNKDVHSIKTNGAALYAGTSGGIFISNDNANSWSPINNGIAETNVISLAVGNGNLFALMRYGSGGSTVYSSSDSGQHWHAGFTFNNPGSGSTVVMAFSANGNDLLIGSYVFYRTGNSGQGVSRSTDNGITFTTADTGLPSNLFVYDFANRGNTIYIGTGSGVFTANNVDYNWAALNSGLPSPPKPIYIWYDPKFINHLAANESYLFATMDPSVDSGGIWRLPLSPKAVERPISNSSTQFALKVSSPNRLNPNVTISFFLLQSEPVTIKVYTVSGREIASVVDKNLLSGSHTLNWNTCNLATGCYTVRMHAGSKTHLKSIPILR